MKNIILLLFLICSINLFSQKEITGTVFSTQGWPLAGVALSQPGATEFVYTNEDGNFKILLDSLYRDELIFNLPDYQEIIIPHLNQKEEAFVVFMFKPQERFKMDSTFYENRNWHFREPAKLSFDLFLDFVLPDYSDFQPYLGERLTDHLDNQLFFFGGEFGFHRKKRFIGLNYSFMISDTGDDNDQPERLETINYSVGVSLGYNLIDRPKFFFTPKLNLRLLRYRIIRRQNDEVSLPEFLDNPDLDLRFRQGITTGGIQFGFRKPNKNFITKEPQSYYAIGCYANYIQKLTRFPDYNGARTIIDTEERINFTKINFGIFFRMGQF